MKAIEFEATIDGGGGIVVPPEVAAGIPSGEQLRVVLIWDSDSDDVWRDAGRRRFEESYADEDSVYEQLMHEASDR